MKILLNKEMLDSKNWTILLKKLGFQNNIHSIVFDVTTYSAYGEIKRNELCNSSLQQISNEFND